MFRSRTLVHVALTLTTGFAGVASAGDRPPSKAAAAPSCDDVQVHLERGEDDCLSTVADGNVAVHWRTERGIERAYAFPRVSEDCCGVEPCYRQGVIVGESLAELESATPRDIDFFRDSGSWRGIESTWWGPETDEPDGPPVLYAWYHEETPGGCGTASPIGAVPRIGAAKSKDGGIRWFDLGTILRAPDETVVEDSANLFFCGGYGDFSVVLDHDRSHFYVFFSSYRRMHDGEDPAGERSAAREAARPRLDTLFRFLLGSDTIVTYGGLRARTDGPKGGPLQQGIAIARLAFADRDEPAGKVEIWDGERWVRHDPASDAYHRVGIVFPATRDWHAACEGTLCPLRSCDLSKAAERHPRCPASGTCSDAPWGPAVHWNESIGRWVMLMNRTCSPCWSTAGHDASFNADLSDPNGWCPPVRIDEVNEWYPQVLPLGRGETDKHVRGRARYTVGGKWCGEIELRRAEVAP
jgi:hypothetical protein